MKSLVIIGGGFAGSKIAKALQNKFKVILIDTKNYFEFTPSILKVIANPSYISKIQKIHSLYLKKSTIVIGEVKEITKTSVKINNEIISYDYLVISSGSDYSYPIKEKNISMVSRSNHLIESNKELTLAKSVAIIGSGAVAIELAGEIKKSFPNKKIKIYTSSNVPVKRNNSKTQKLILKYLKENKVLFIANKKINFPLKEKLADHIFICTGIKSNSKFLKDNSFVKLNEKGQIITNKFLQIRRNIFAAGDIVAINEEKTAQTAEFHANSIIRNLKNLEKNISLKKYRSIKRPMVISLGNLAILETKYFVIKGKFPLLLKYIIERKTMINH